jgi:NAD-dependent dihydropyrimidine dehydrogenase PreA subunit
MVDVKKWKENENWVKINLDLCMGIAECVNVCPSEVYTLIDGKVIAENIDNCIQCLVCQDICPNKATLNHFAW